MDFRDDFFDEGDAKEDVIQLLTDEMSSVKRRLSEIKDQIDSMQNSVDREQNRYSNIATEIRNIKDNLDTVPREDIRDKYDDALQVRFRLATMRGQLEKFEATYEFFENQQQTLTQILSSLQGYDVLVDDTNTTGQQSGVDVIGMVRAQEDERQRLARAMHDGPAQSLTNFILQAEICQRLFDRNPDRAAEELINLKTNASSTFQKIRDFIFDLRPMMLDDLGVVPTVRRYVESFQEKNDIETKLNISGEERRLENHLEVMAFRSVQDVMSMSRDYAGSTTMDVALEMNSDPLRITIEDDGKGFDTEAIFDETEIHTNDARVQALRMLKSKIELVGGEVSVNSNENDGTVVRIELPVGEF